MAAVNAPRLDPIPEEYFDPQVSTATVKIQTDLRGFNHIQLFQVLSTNLPGFKLSTVAGCWKTDKPGVLFLTFYAAPMAQILLQVGSLSFDNSTITFSCYEKQVVELRVHWLNADIRHSFIRKYFAQFGRVLNVKHESMVVGGVTMFTGVRLVTLELSNSGRARIPHIVRFGETVSMLITAPGRMPICLRCHTLGHLRATCPQTIEARARYLAMQRDREDRLRARQHDEPMEDLEHVRERAEQTRVCDEKMREQVATVRGESANECESEGEDGAGGEMDQSQSQTDAYLLKINLADILPKEKPTYADALSPLLSQAVDDLWAFVKPKRRSRSAHGTRSKKSKASVTPIPTVTPPDSRPDVPVRVVGVRSSSCSSTGAPSGATGDPP